VAPATEELALILTLVAQARLAPVAERSGELLLAVTVILALPDPAELVPFTVKVPAVLTVMLEPEAVKLLGPVQLYVVVPEAVVLAVRVVDVLVQVNTPEWVADALTAIPDTLGETGFARRTLLYNDNN
jgi:hypothetical protein